jgi:hypothetical protein
VLRLATVKNDGAVFAHGFTDRENGALGSYLTGGVTHTLTYDDRDRVDQGRRRVRPAPPTMLRSRSIPSMGGSPRRRRRP